MSTTLNRRTFLGLTAGATAGTFLHPAPLHAVEMSAQVRAVAFDAFPIFGPRPIFALAEETLSRKGSGVGKSMANTAVRIYLASHPSLAATPTSGGSLKTPWSSPPGI